MAWFRSLSLIVPFIVLHFGNSLPISAQQPGEIITKVRRTSDTNGDRSVFKLLSVSTGRYVGVDSNGTLIADSDMEDSNILFKAHAIDGGLIAIECPSNGTFIVLMEATFKCMVSSNALNFTVVNPDTAQSALQEANSGCLVAFDPYAFSIIPNYCQAECTLNPGYAQVFLDRISI